ncbi:superoxide dismutase [Xylanimonas oleitrophica]|uniref:Superoxide dismutase [Cu-Zn] n=1 Tax=Xylanimonas oleitrophica TaxID=2607479 RepID=A0A2W5XTL6_9MICO|nr:superoxide dismutase family protein [Xylanimonas oleitrophica]PZR53438.1 superoxide dismutase [Xylanimonas oleitrophica]
MRHLRPLGPTTAVAAVAALTLAGCAAGGATSESDATAETDLTAPTEAPAASGAVMAHATLTDVSGDDVGMVTFTQADGVTEVSVEVEGLDPGFYAFHVHAVGLCEPESSPPDDPSQTGAFLSAGGHLGADDDDHGAHAGDLPPIYVTEDGEGSLVTRTDRLTQDELFDDDGSAVMVHAGRDNFANVPERYAPDGPDEDTLATGDAGDRIACGVVE